jgi:O-antigen ligase
VSGLAALGAAAFVVTSETVSLLWTYFQFLDTNSERQTLYTDGLRMGVESALFGRGPGKHVMLRGELDDAHQTLLTILLQGGVLALLAFLSLVVRTVSEVLDRPYLLAAIVSLAMYVLGGDVLRRMPFWVQLALILGAARESVDSGSPDRSSRPVTSGGQAHAVSY